MTAQDKDRIECAIRHIKTAVDVDPWAVEIAVEAMKAQLSREDTTSDLISRQSAIDVLGVFTQADALGHTPKQIVEALPSAQSEIVRCKDCKHHWIHRCMDSMPTEICEVGQTFYDANVDFCSLAERRTDGFD